MENSSLTLQEVFAMACGQQNSGVAVPVSVLPNPWGGETKFSSNFDPSSREACMNAMAALEHMGCIHKGSAVYFYAPSYIQKISGPSIGLAAALALMRYHGLVGLRGPWWVTGEVTPFGSVLPVGGLEIKLSNPSVQIGKVMVPAGYKPPKELGATTISHLKELMS